jgi:hypothetical protein
MTISSPTTRYGRRGFAIGLIFAAVLAVGLLLGFLSLQTQNASQQGTQQQSLSFSSSVLQQGSLQQNAFRQFSDASGLKDLQIYAFKDNNADTGNGSCAGLVPPCWNRAENVFGPRGTINLPKFDLTAYDAGLCTQETLKSETSDLQVGTQVSDRACIFYITRRSTVSNPYTGQFVASGGSQYSPSVATGTTYTFFLSYTAPLKTSVCNQINSNLWGPVSTGVPVYTAFNTGTLRKIGVPPVAGDNAPIVAVTVNTPQPFATFTLGTQSLPIINGVVRGEGCTNSANAAVSPSTPALNTYYKILKQVQ